MYESAIRLRHLLLCFESNSKGQILHQTAITFTVGILQLEGGKHHEMPKSEMNILKKKMKMHFCLWNTGEKNH